MKYLLLVIALVAAVVLAALFVPIKDGKPLLDWQQVESAASDPQRLMDGSAMGESGQAPTFYRWRDSNGQWQYGDRPPPGVAAEPVETKPAKGISSEAVKQGRLEDSQNTQ